MNTTLETGSRARELAAICGAGHVEEDPALEAFAIDGVAPAIAVSPASAEEVAQVVAFAAAQNLTVVPAGGFTAMASGGCLEKPQASSRESANCSDMSEWMSWLALARVPYRVQSPT